MALNNEKAIKVYQAIDDLDKPRVMENWHASSLGQCPRSQYYARKGVERLNKPTSALRLRWAAGHAIEEAIRPYVEHLYKDVKSNQRLTSDKLKLTGEYDNLSGNTIIEVKSVHDYAFKEDGQLTGLKLKIGEKTSSTGRTTNQWGIKPDPYLHHELQNHAYVELLKEQGVEIKQIDYLYLSLSGRVVVYSEPVKQEVTDMVHKRLDLLNKHWEEQTPPPCICDQVNHPLYAGVMSYCDYKSEHECCSLNLIKEK